MNLTEEIKAAMGGHWAEFETLLRETINSRSIMLNKINSYLFDTSGKQLRPLLALVTAKACSGLINKRAVVCAAVSELIHTATLLHDDVVDDSDLRRGKVTVKKVFSSGASVLIGDFWFTRAINLLITHNCPYPVLAVYSEALSELAEGEMLQMDFADNLLAVERDYIDIIRRKTASLFIASVTGAAIVSGASEKVVDELQQFAYCLGCCFQIRDDIIDYYPSEVSGKDSGSDILERKVTMPLLCAMKACPSKDAEIRQSMRGISMLPADRKADIAIAESVRNFVLENNGLDLAKSRLSDYITEAKKHLEVLEESEFKGMLGAIADYMQL